MTKEQKEILKLVIMEYTHNFEHSMAHRLFDQIMKSGLDKVYFDWIGSDAPIKPHYYLLNGPDFLIEMDNYQGRGIISTPSYGRRKTILVKTC